MNYLRSLFNPLPSFFDICVGGFLAIFFFYGNGNRSIFFVFYSMFLVILSFGMKPKREYRSYSLALLGLWSFLGLFIHSFALYPASFTYSYKIFYLAIEGFIFMLFGILFLRTVVVYSTNPRFIYFLIPFAVLPLVPGLVRVGSSTALVALGISVLIYLFISAKNRWLTVGASFISTILVITNWHWLFFKFRGRPYIWYQLIRDMFYNPVKMEGKEIAEVGVQLSPCFEKWLSLHAPFAIHFKPWLASIFGSGFSDGFQSEYKWVVFNGYKFGWAHRQNDYLSVANYLGPIALVFLAWFIAQTLKIIGIRPVLILFLAVLLTCSAQLTMFDPGKAAVCLTIMGLCITDGLRKGEKA